MREIKFRMWNSCGDKSKFLYSFQALECMNQQQLGIYDHEKDGCAFEQFTGLRDKNGKEVWEGDIVSRNVPHARAGAIQFAQGIFGINWDYGQNPDPLWLEGTMYGLWNGKHNLRPIDDNFMTENMEVIGNIHETPELLEAGK